MAVTFSADEIFEMAEQIERNGAKFYTTASDLAQGDTRTMLQQLAEMEIDHEKTFAHMRAELNKLEKQPSVADVFDEAAQYLRSMVEGKVFTNDPNTFFDGSRTLEDVFKFAIAIEKDSIVFYQGIKGMVPSDTGKDKIDGIIKEEYGHINIINSEYQKIAQ